MPVDRDGVWEFAHQQGDPYSYENPDDHSDFVNRYIAPLVPAVVAATLPHWIPRPPGAAAPGVSPGLGVAPGTSTSIQYPECAGVANLYGYSGWAEELEANVIGFATSVGIRCSVTSRGRKCHEQAALYRAGRTTAAPTTSQHEFGLAFDVVPTSGFQQYGATKADAIAWLVALSRHFGCDGLVEGDHAHLTVFSNDTWQWFLWLRTLGFALPIPSRRP